MFCPEGYELMEVFEAKCGEAVEIVWPFPFAYSPEPEPEAEKYVPTDWSKDWSLQSGMLQAHIFDYFLNLHAESLRLCSPTGTILKISSIIFTSSGNLEYLEHGSKKHWCDYFGQVIDKGYFSFLDRNNWQVDGGKLASILEGKTPLPCSATLQGVEVLTKFSG